MSVVDVLQAGDALTNKRGSRELFYWLKIHGIDRYFCCGINPTAAKWGSAAWALPSGYTAVGGMDLPDSNLEQSLNDIIGGVATPEHIRLRLTDFRAFDSSGEYFYLSRLFSPGIATSTPGGYFELASDIPASFGDTDPISLRTGTVTPANGYYTIGQETLRLESFGAPVNGISTGTIVGARNRFPCSSVYPAIPYHRVVRNETDGAALGRNILVTPYGTPFTMDGRPAAFYIGAMDRGGPEGQPMPEADGLMRLVGRIRGRRYGNVGAGGATYELELVGVMDDLDGAVLAPGLGVAKIKPDQILLPDSDEHNWLGAELLWGDPGGNFHRRWDIEVDSTGITDGNFTLDRLIGRVNATLAGLAQSLRTDAITCRKIVGDDGQTHVAFLSYNQEAPGIFTIRASRHSFLAALGFESEDANVITARLDEKWDSSVDSAAAGLVNVRAVAQRPAPSVFIPATHVDASDPVRFRIQGADGSTSQFFFTDQGDGRAYVQFGDGTIVTLETTDSTGGAHLTTGERWQWSMSYLDWITQMIKAKMPDPFYYVGLGDVATVKQVVIAGDRNADTDAGLLVGRFLASHDEASTIDDLNYYPEGVGLGLNQILDGESVRAIAAYGKSYAREIIVDSSTKLSDLMGPIVKAYGLGVVWDPEQAKIAFRPLRTPAAPHAHAIVLSESNRADPADRTSQEEDAANVRLSWTLELGYDWTEKKFTGPTTTLVDNIVQSGGSYQKDEKIEDKTLQQRSELDPIEYLTSLVFARDYLYQQPWLRCDRTLNCCALTLAPGSYHQIVDNTLVNPFTGRPGITAADGLYILILSVSANPYNGKAGRVSFLINRTRKSGLYRAWSPCALVDYAAAGHGYDNGTGVLTLKRQYSSHATNEDGYDFRVGDTVRLLSRHAVDGAFTYDQVATVLALAADGSTATVAAGLGAISDGTEVVMYVQDYQNATATRKLDVAFQGDEGARIIQAVAGAELHRWA